MAQVVVATINDVAITENRVASWTDSFAPVPLRGHVQKRDGKADRAFCKDEAAHSLKRLKRSPKALVRQDGQGRRGNDYPQFDALERNCMSALALARSETLGFLIRTEWIQRESDKRGIAATRADVARTLNDRVGRFERRADFERYLASSGMSEEQFRNRSRRDSLAYKLMMAVEAPDLSVSRADIQRVYRRNSAQYSEPAARDVRAVVTRSRTTAHRARRALTTGSAWSSVVRRFTVDASKQNGGHVVISRRNSLKVLRDTVFSARVGQIIGPIEIKGAWWVFRVDRERGVRSLPVGEAASRIRASIRSTREQLAFDRLMAYLTRHYRPYTVCHKGYSAPECRNGRMPAVPSVSASGAY